MERALKAVKRSHPGADEYRVGLYMDSVYVEVWRKGSAKIVTYEED
jgi:hypothetical protein